MRIMDGTSRRKKEEPEKKRRQLDMKAREEALRRYEEAVYVSYVVESSRNKVQFGREFEQSVRKKYAG